MAGKKTTDKKESSWVGEIEKYSRQIWLAGLGAYSKVSKDGSKLFETLVKDGEKAEKQARTEVDKSVGAVKSTARSARSKVDEVKDRALGKWGELEEAFDKRLNSAISRLGVPSRNEVKDLHAKVETLTRQIEKLTGVSVKSVAKPAAKAAAKPAAKAAAKPTAKPAAKTAAAKPAAKAAAKPAAAKAAAKPAAKPAAAKAAAKPAAKPAAAKPAAKPAAAKPAAKPAAAKKPAVKKPAAPKAAKPAAAATPAAAPAPAATPAPAAAAPVAPVAAPATPPTQA